MVFDTDVLIWYLRGNENATKTVVESLPFSISIVTYMELVQGMRNKNELSKVKKAFNEMKVSIIPISEAISMRAASYVEEHSLSSSMEMADALIASTCIETNQSLCTANDKHYRVVTGLDLKIFRPQ